VNNYESRLLALERLCNRQAAQLAALAARLAAMEQQLSQNWASQSWDVPGSGGAVDYATTPAGGIAAGGSAMCTLDSGPSVSVANGFTYGVGAGVKFSVGQKSDGTYEALGWVRGVGYATTPAGGIPAGGSATCTGGTLPGGSGVVNNPFTTAIAGSKKITYGVESDGVTLLFLSEDC
jgi:hypothetical protein